MTGGAAFYALSAVAVLLTGVSKGGFGGALGGIAVPLMALAMPAPRAAAIMLPMLCLTDVVGFRAYYGKWDRALLRVMIPGGLAGIAVGALTIRLLSDDVVRLLVGSIAIAFPLYRWLAPRTATPPAEVPRGAPPATRGACWSGLSGYTSFLAHAGGPPVMVFLLPLGIDKTTYVATVNLFFMVMNSSKIVPYAVLGQFSREDLLASLALAPLVPAGVWLGLALHRRIDERWFFQAVQVLMLVTGLQLVWKATGPQLLQLALRVAAQRG